MSLESITETIKQKMAMAAGLSAKAKFDFGDDGYIFVDNTVSPPEVSHDTEEEPDVSLICSMDVFQGLLDGTQDPNIAFMMGKLKVKGNMGLAMKLNSILED